MPCSDDNNLIGVGYKSKGEISLHNPDGSLIKTLAAPGIDTYMAISNQQLIYSTNSDKHTLMCVDLNNNKSNRIHTYKDGIPHGVCCDKVGDIYVIVHQRVMTVKYSNKEDWNSQLKIYHYSAGTNPEVKVTENNDVEDIFHDITYTPHGKLALVGSKCTQIYHRDSNNIFRPSQN